MHCVLHFVHWSVPGFAHLAEGHPDMLNVFQGKAPFTGGKRRPSRREVFPGSFSSNSDRNELRCHCISLHNLVAEPGQYGASRCASRCAPRYHHVLTLASHGRLGYDVFCHEVFEASPKALGDVRAMEHGGEVIAPKERHGVLWLLGGS